MRTSRWRESSPVRLTETTLPAAVAALARRFLSLFLSFFLRPLYWAYERLLQRQIADLPRPRHLAIIMDGNRRYAVRHALPSPVDGHRRGAAKLKEVLTWCLESRVKVLTVWALSIDNIERRDADELAALYDACVDELDTLSRSDEVRVNRVRVRFFGRRSRLPKRVLCAMDDAESRTGHHDGHLLNVALAYGGREEIADAVGGFARSELERAREIAAAEGLSAGEALDLVEKSLGGMQPRDITGRLYTSGVPEPDFIIRTSGEMRMGGFLLWQAAYAEFYFCDALWPAFRRIDFLRALRSFGQRSRRFGK